MDITKDFIFVISAVKNSCDTRTLKTILSEQSDTEISISGNKKNNIIDITKQLTICNIENALKDKVSPVTLFFKSIMEKECKKVARKYSTIKWLEDIDNIKKYIRFNKGPYSKFLGVCYFYILNKNDNNNIELIEKNLTDIYLCILKGQIDNLIVTLMEASKFFKEGKEGKNNNGITEEEIMALLKELEELKNENASLAAANKLLTKNNKVNVRQTDNLVVELDKLKETIVNAINVNLNKNNKELTEFFDKAKYNVLEKTYNRSLDKLSNEVSEHKANNKILLKENKELKKELEILKNKISVLENNNIQKNEPSDIVEEIILEKNNENDHSENIQNENTKIDYVNNNKIVWCKNIIPGEVIGVKSDGTEVVIKNIPDLTYLNIGFFVVIDKENNFCYNLKSYTNKDIYPNIKFGATIYQNGKYVINKELSGEIIEPNKDLKVQEDMVVGLDRNNEIKVIFKRYVPDLNDFKAHIECKKHHVFYILKILPNGFLVRDVLKNKEKFVNMEGNTQILREGDLVVCNKDNVMLGTMPNMLYLQSSINTHKKYYIINITKNNEVYGKAQNGNLIKLNDPNYIKFEDGDVVAVDEFNNILFLVDADTKLRIPTFKRIKNKLNETDIVNIIGNVLIIGNLSFASSYKMAFLKEGFKANVVEGFISYNKISQQLKDNDYIICVTTCCSHDNMWKLKENVKDNIIFTKNDGANRLVEELMNKINNNNNIKK